MLGDRAPAVGQLRVVTDRFSGPGRAIVRVCVCVFQTITFEPDDLPPWDAVRLGII